MHYIFNLALLALYVQYVYKDRQTDILLTERKSIQTYLS